MRSPGKALAPAIVAALVAAGCGGGDGDPDPTPQGALPETVTAPATAAPASSGIPSNRFDPGAIYRRVSSGVVTVISIHGNGAGAQAGQGSGFVINRAGEVVTNAHVVTTGQGNSIRRARRVYIEFADRNKVAARIIGFDPFADVALLRVSTDGLRLTPIPLSDGRGMAVGQPVAAIGSPFGETGSLSVGVISGVDRSVQSLTSFEINNAIQTDAAINHGNSGGPLLDSRGRVIGINQQIESTSGGGEGVGFAVPVTAVRRSIRQLRRDGRVDYAYIGISSQDLYPQLARRLGLKRTTGVLVAQVVRGGPAARAGIRGGRRQTRFQGGRVALGGDVVLAVGGVRVSGGNELSRAVASRRPGDTVTVELLRDGKRRQVRVKLGTRPQRLPRTG
jgi:S1-C subfamily serine protease